MPLNLHPQQLVGKLALVSVQYFDTDRSTLLEEKKVYGHVNVVGEEHGIGMILKDNSHFTLPFSVDAWQPAPAGIYEDEESGEQILNPDYLVQWHVYRVQDETKREEGQHEWWEWEPAN